MTAMDVSYMIMSESTLATHVTTNHDKQLPPIYLFRWGTSHCEISGWGMQEYNNTASYPDSIRAARIKVRKIHKEISNILYP